MKKQEKSFNYIAGVEKNKFWLYLLFLIVSVIISVVIIVLGCFWNNSLLNYLCSLSASLVATPIFAYLLELIVTRQEENRRSTRIKSLIGPTAIQTKVLAFRIQALTGEGVTEIKDAVATFEQNYKRVFSEYCGLISIIKNNKSDLVVLNKAFNIKNGIEEYSLKAIKENLEALFKGEFFIKGECLLNDSQLYLLKQLDEIVDGLKLPFLGELKKDHNHSQITTDWPDGDIPEITINNYNNSIGLLVSTLNGLAKEFDEFSIWKKE